MLMGNTKRGLGLVLVVACACGDYDASSGGARGGLEGAANGEAREPLPLPSECDAVQDWDPESIALEEEMLRLINEARASGASCAGPTHPLEMHDALRCAARLHSMDMNESDFYQHVNPEGNGPRERMEAVGYDLGPWGENIVKEPASAQEAMDVFMESPGHCANIMSSEITIVGIGVHGTTWTQDFSN
jgi:uncharacterized protein YkwD